MQWKLTRYQPIGEAYGVLFISSDLAKTITGQVLTIDGGCTMV